MKFNGPRILLALCTLAALALFVLWALNVFPLDNPIL